MSNVTEITDLFARLASHLEASSSSPPSSSRGGVSEEDDEGRALQLAVSDLNRSLNLRDDSRVRVLDTALSLMGFRAPQVFDSVVKYSVETIVSVLSSSIGCKVLRFQRDEVLLIGSPISRPDCANLIEACSNVLVKLERQRAQYEYLLSAVLRFVISSSFYRYLHPSRPILDVKSIDARSMTVSKFLSNLPKGLFLHDNNLPFRLQSWFLDPLTLKNDISNILRESMERPFLCLCEEFHKRMDWRSTTKCLALSPTMFIETRALLHRWFLLTGLSSVLELLIALCTVMLDVVSRPIRWDISMELGAKLPFSNAYFPHQHQLLRILAGPLSHVSLQDLAHVASESLLFTGKQFDPPKTPVMKSETIDHKSGWALAINFPCWFYFASALLFSEKRFQENSYSECVLEASKTGSHYEEPPSSAARYIAWILNPASRYNQDILADYLVRISKSLASKQFGSGTHENKIANDRKILKKPKSNDKEYNTRLQKYDCQIIEQWLKELKNAYMMYGNTTTKSSASCNKKLSCDQSMQQNALFRRIPLGILLGCLNYVNKDACELLLHYATSERIFQWREARSSSLKRIKCNHGGKKDVVSWIDEYNKEEAVSGACLVFAFTDIVETMSASLFDTEEAGLDFICQVKTMIGRYLIRCIERQIQLEIGDGKLLAMDLCRRLEQWRHQGQRVLGIHKDVDNLINILSNKLSSI